MAAEGLRPTLADSAPPGLNDLLTRCWALDPSQRPSAAALVAELSQIRAALMQSPETDGRAGSAVDGAEVSRQQPPKQQAVHAQRPGERLGDTAAAWYTRLPPQPQAFEPKVMGPLPVQRPLQRLWGLWPDSQLELSAINNRMLHGTALQAKWGSHLQSCLLAAMHDGTTCHLGQCPPRS